MANQILSNKTPLYDYHLQANAKMVDFHGWQMPINYGSQIQEHISVRTKFGMFDVSHMNIVDLIGIDCEVFLKKILTNNIDQLSSDGKALYSCLCNEDGGILDDLIVYRISHDCYRLVLNSATKEKDMLWIRLQLNSFNIKIEERQDLSMIAVQGPCAINMVAKIFDEGMFDLESLQPFECRQFSGYFFARTGYTGEDGLEIIATHDKIISLWNELINHGVPPCGLGARDTLRLEAGLLLYGQDMDENTTPLESGLAWTVTFQPETRDFIGMDALINQKKSGIPRKLVGLVLNGPGVMRAGQIVQLSGDNKGIITSGSFSPTLNKSIALARIPNISGLDLSDVQVIIRDHKVPAIVTKPRFVKQGKIII